VEKVDLCEGHWNPQRKIREALHFLKTIRLESQIKNAEVCIFLKKKERIFFTDFLRIALTYRKANTLKKI